MIYKNKKTGAIIFSNCKCEGSWEEVKETEKEPKETKKKKNAKQ